MAVNEDAGALSHVGRTRVWMESAQRRSRRPSCKGPEKTTRFLRRHPAGTAGWRAAAALCWNPRRKLRFL